MKGRGEEIKASVKEEKKRSHEKIVYSRHRELY